MNPTLDDLQPRLDAVQHFPPEYRDDLSSHLPMALHALHALGASRERQQAFVQHYARRFDPTQPMPNEFAALRRCYAGEIAAQGIEATLRSALPALWPGVSAAGLHGLIRTAHAAAGGHAGEVAQGLAYWAWRWQGLPAPTQAAPALAAEDWTAALARAGDDWRAQAPLISGRMRLAGDSPAYRRLAAGLRLDEDTLPALARFAARRYARTGNFTLLHLVTGCHAARVLLPWCADRTAVAGHLAQAFCAGYLASGAGSAHSDVTPPARDWAAAIDAARASDDDHVIKIVNACREQCLALEAAPGNGPWLHAACRALA